MKRDKCVRTYEAWFLSPRYASVNILDDPPPFPNIHTIYALYGGYFCKEKLLLSSQNSFIWYCKIVKFNIFELGIFSFNSYVYYLTRGFIASTRAFNLPIRAFSVLTRGFELAARNSCFTFPRALYWIFSIFWENESLLGLWYTSA